jgi:hypothetical protein
MAALRSHKTNHRIGQWMRRHDLPQLGAGVHYRPVSLHRFINHHLSYTSQ